MSTRSTDNDRPATTSPTTPSETSIDGVPVLWSDLAHDPTATLTFAVGYRDTGPVTAGITHLVEHLVMRRIGPVDGVANAASGLDMTVFYVSGSQEAQAACLAAVCEAITWVRTVTDEHLDVERRTILAEIGHAGTYLALTPASARYGLDGLGASAAAHTRLMAWTAEEVRDVAARWFHRGNAALTLTTPPWDGLRLPLPAGPAVHRPAAPAPRLTSPVATEHEHATIDLSGTVSRRHSPAVRTIAARTIDVTLTEALRHTSGHVYDVDVTRFNAGDAQLWSIEIDPPSDATLPALRTLLDGLRRLAQHGPEPRVLDRAKRALSAEIALPSHQAATLDLIALARLRDEDPPARDAHALAAVSVDDVKAIVAELLDVPLLLLPEGSTDAPELEQLLDETGLAPLDRGPDPEGRDSRAVIRDLYFGRRGRRFAHAWRRLPVHRGRWFSPARGTEVAVTEDRIVVLGPGIVLTMLIDDIVLIGTDADGEVEIVSRTGASAVLRPADYRGLARALAAAATPRAVRYDKSGTALG